MRRLNALLIALALVAPAFADEAPPSAVRAMKAELDLKRYVDDIAASGGLPDFRQPPASDLFRQAFDVDALAALPPPQASDLSWLLDWAYAVNETSKAIVLRGVKPGPSPDLAVIARNLELYEDQYAAAADFIVRVDAREVIALELFRDALGPVERNKPIRAAGVARAKSGAAEMIENLLVVITRNMRAANARRVTAALRDTGEVWAAFLDPGARKQIVDRVAQATQQVADEEARASLARFASILEAAK